MDRTGAARSGGGRGAGPGRAWVCSAHPAVSIPHPHSWERVRGPAGLQPTQAEAEQAVPTRSLTQWDGSSGHASVAGGGDTGPEGCGDLL